MVEEDWWTILGCERDAPEEVRRERYRTLAQIYHPDRHVGASEPVRQEAANRMASLNEAMTRAARPDRERAPESHGRSGPQEQAAGATGDLPVTAAGYRHPSGAEWFAQMERRRRAVAREFVGDPGRTFAACVAYVESRRRWKLGECDGKGLCLSFRGRVGMRTFEGQEVAVWFEEVDSSGSRFRLVAVAESHNGQLAEWNEAPTILKELVQGTFD